MRRHAFRTGAVAILAVLFTAEKGMPKDIGKLRKPISVFTGGSSSDHGDVTLIAPTATVHFPGGIPGAIGHHWSTVTAGFGSSAWRGLNTGAKVMAATAIDLMTSLETLKEIRDEFEEYSKEHPYKSFLPEDAKPPLDFYEDLMNQFLPEMRKHYVE